MTAFRAVVPLFPLPRCVLFPHALLPLHIFEPRYRRMTEYALAEDRRIAVAQLGDGYEKQYKTPHAPIPKTVCVGKIIEHAALDDGRYNFLLKGLWRGCVIGERVERGFRLATIERVADDEKSFAPCAEGIMADLRDATAVAVAGGAVAPEVVDFAARTADNCAALVDLLAYHLVPVEESELRQQLLDETNVETRAKALIARIAELANDGE